MDSENNINNNVILNNMDPYPLNKNNKNDKNNKYCKISESILDNPDNMYINDININIKINYNYKNINTLIINNFLDEPEKYMYNEPLVQNENNQYTLIKEKQIDYDIEYDIEHNIEFHKNEINNFFECFDEELSINNTIPCDNIHISDQHCNKNLNELTTSYVFENCDIKKRDIDPFLYEENQLEKIKNKKHRRLNGKLGIIAFSTALIMGGGSWLNEICNF